MGVRASKCVVPTEERAGVLAAVARDSDGMALELPQLRAREREALQADPEVVLTAVRSVSILERCRLRPKLVVPVAGSGMPAPVDQAAGFPARHGSGGSTRAAHCKSDA